MAVRRSAVCERGLAGPGLLALQAAPRTGSAARGEQQEGQRDSPGAPEMAEAAREGCLVPPVPGHPDPPGTWVLGERR